MEEEEKNKKEVEEKAGAKGEQVWKSKEWAQSVTGELHQSIEKNLWNENEKAMFLANFKCERSSAGSAL